jgi:poly-beta-hydroxyalkanoate depolymerase
VAQVDTIRGPYEEYFAMADLPAEFHPKTVERIFQEATRATRAPTFLGRHID